MLETKRLIIRVVEKTDLDELFEYMSDALVMKYEFGEYTNKKDLLETIEYFMSNKGMFVMIVKDSGKLIGHITFTKNQPYVFNEYNIGYILHPHYQGKGYCTEAAKRVIQYGFEELHIHRVSGKCNPENKASWKVLEKLGLKREGHFKNRVCFRNDEFGNPIYTDEYSYALNIEDYQKDKEKD